MSKTLLQPDIEQDTNKFDQNGQHGFSLNVCVFMELPTMVCSDNALEKLSLISGLVSRIVAERLRSSSFKSATSSRNDHPILYGKVTRAHLPSVVEFSALILIV